MKRQNCKLWVTFKPPNERKSSIYCKGCIHLSHRFFHGLFRILLVTNSNIKFTEEGIILGMLSLEKEKLPKEDIMF